MIHTIFYLTLLLSVHISAQIIVIVDAAGDMHELGRIIDGEFERTIMLQCAQALKQELEKYPSITVILTRLPGEYIHQHAKAQLANQYATHLYIRLQAYQDTHPKVQLHIMRYANDHPLIRYTKHDLISFQDAYMASAEASYQYAIALEQQLKEHHRFVTIKNNNALCIPALQGIRQPALCLEMGLKHAGDWHFIINPLVQALRKVLA